MESLVAMAKRLGIRPNPKMSKEEKSQSLKKIYQEIRRYFPKTKIPLNLENVDLAHIKNNYYDLHKKVVRPIQDKKQFEKNYDSFEQVPKEIKIFTQSGAFRWHDARQNGDVIQERFVADVQLDSPCFPEMIKKLDDFILKYKASYKIPVRGKKGNRSDTMNLYFPEQITPEVAKEFVQIVRPCLSETYDDYLNGRTLTEKGRVIKGIRIGPEYKVMDTDKGLSVIRSMKKKVKEDLGSLGGEFDMIDSIRDLVWHTSLGQKESAISTLDLAYYLAGKEGQNPYQLLSYDGKPYRKSLEIAEGGRGISKAPVVHPKSVPVAKKVFVPTPVRKVLPVSPVKLAQKRAVSPVPPKAGTFQDLLKALSQEILGLRKEVKSCHQEITSLRTYQVETRKRTGKV